MGWSPFSRSSGLWSQGWCLGGSMLIGRQVWTWKMRKWAWVWGSGVGPEQPHQNCVGEMEQKQLSELENPGCRGFDGFSVQHVCRRRATQAVGMQGCWPFPRVYHFQCKQLSHSCLISASFPSCPSLFCSPSFSSFFSAYVPTSWSVPFAFLLCFSLVSLFDTIFVLGCAIYIF